MKFKLLGYIFIILAGLAIVSGLYYWQVTRLEFPEPVKHQNEAANWKTYTNTKYGFEFRYPSSWPKVTAISAFSGDYLPTGRSFVAIYPDSYPAQDFSGRIDVYDVPKSQVLKDNPYTKYGVKAPDSTINGITWTQYDTLNGKDFFTEKAGKTYEVSASEEITNQILSTFKFLDQANETSDWKTYTNTQFGIEFKYPSDASITIALNDQIPGPGCGDIYKPMGCIVVKVKFPNESSFYYRRVTSPEGEPGTDRNIFVAGKERKMHTIPRNEFHGELYGIGLDNIDWVGFTNQDGDADYQVFLKILSTFKFIN